MIIYIQNLQYFYKNCVIKKTFNLYNGSVRKKIPNQSEEFSRREIRS